MSEWLRCHSRSGSSPWERRCVRRVLHRGWHNNGNGMTYSAPCGHWRLVARLMGRECYE